VRQSGEVDRRGALSKHGPPHLRWALIEAAHNAIRVHPPYRALLERHRARLGRQRGGSVAAITVGRRLAEAIWWMLTRNPGPRPPPRPEGRVMARRDHDRARVLLDSRLEDVVDCLVQQIYTELTVNPLHDDPELAKYLAGRVAQRFGYRVSLPELQVDRPAESGRD
jgi:Transposase IS116/IS110/IS902 family